MHRAREGTVYARAPLPETELVSVRRKEKSPVRRRGQVEVVSVVCGVTGRPSGRPSLFAIRPSWVIVFARQQHIRFEQRQQKPLIPDDPLALEGENEGGGRVVARDPRQFDIGAGVGPRQLVALQRFDLRASSGFPAQSVGVSQDSPPSATDACYTAAHEAQRH